MKNYSNMKTAYLSATATANGCHIAFDKNKMLLLYEQQIDLSAAHVIEQINKDGTCITSSGRSVEIVDAGHLQLTGNYNEDKVLISEFSEVLANKLNINCNGLIEITNELLNGNKRLAWVKRKEDRANRDPNGPEATAERENRSKGQKARRAKAKASTI